MRTPSLIVIAVAALAATGCGERLEGADRAIDDLVSTQVGAAVESVTCPSDIEPEKGGTFDCTVTGVDGTTGVARATQQDDRGNVDYSVPFVHPRELEQSMLARLARQTKADPGGSRIKCPEIITAEAGGTFQCTVEGGPKPITLNVTQKDDQGNVTFRVAP